MSYIGNEPTSVAFLTDTFNGNGTTTVYTMTVAPATTSSILVSITGVLQDPSTYSVTGTTLTFSAAPPSGTGNISVRYLGIPASGVTTTAYRTVTEFTATAGQTTFSVPSYTVGYIDVYRNGVLLGSADYTASNGTTVVLASGATAGDLIETISFYVSSVLNALPTSGGTLSGNLVVNGSETVSGNLGVGTTNIVGTGKVSITQNNTNITLGETNPNEAGMSFWSNAITTPSNSNAFTLGMDSVAAGSGAFIWNRNSSYIKFGTNNTERMRLDANGILTQPFKPAFFARKTNGGAMAPVNPVLFNDVVTNIGSYYNASTGRFTAPVAGNYYFVSTAHTETTNNTARALIFYVNGVNRGYAYVLNATGSRDNIVNTCIFTLAENDYVTVGTDTSDFWAGDSSGINFTGFLIG